MGTFSLLSGHQSTVSDEVRDSSVARQKIRGYSRESTPGTSEIKRLSALPGRADLAVTRV